MTSEIKTKAKLAKQAAGQLAKLPRQIKDWALERLAENLIARSADIIRANQLDLLSGQVEGLSKAWLDRLRLDEKRVTEMAQSVLAIKELPDPIGGVIKEWSRPNGLRIKKVAVPLGVIGIIYEARPNVTVDAAALCLKTGNAVVLRGSHSALNSNKTIVEVIKESLNSAGVPEGAVELITDPDKKAVKTLLKLHDLIDVIIPRGGAGLINFVVKHSHIPVLETGVGNCHVYVEKTAKLEMAEAIIFNAKCQRPGVCNAMETLLVDEPVAPEFLPAILKRLKDAGVEIRGCAKTKKIDASVKDASQQDWSTEYLDLILAVKVVAGLDQAIDHINRYGTRHSEAIVTEDPGSAEKFTVEVDAAAVYINASTRFTDGGEFGFGAEMGISTQKLHARGPLGLPELTSYKYIIFGEGQVRQ